MDSRLVFLRPLGLRLIAFVGPTGCGKTSILKGALKHYVDRAAHENYRHSTNNNKYLRVKGVTTTTDRQQRPGEVNGVDYIFLPTALFKKSIENDKFVETKSSVDNSGNVIYYGLTKNALGNLEDDSILLLSIDLGGLIKLTEYLNDQELCSEDIIFPIYIDASAEERISRCIAREAGKREDRNESCNDKLVYKTCERMLHDTQEIEDSIDFCTLKLKNENEGDKNECINFVVKLIQGML